MRCPLFFALLICADMPPFRALLAGWRERASTQIEGEADGLIARLAEVVLVLHFLDGLWGSSHVVLVLALLAFATTFAAAGDVIHLALQALDLVLSVLQLPPELLDDTVIGS